MYKNKITTMVINWRNKLDTEAKKNENTQYNRDLRSFEIRFKFESAAQFDLIRK